MSTRPQSQNPRRAQKTNLNLTDLLNFTLPPRQTHHGSNLPRRSKRPAAQGFWNKERFVNAQYRFVMNPNGDYTVHFADPDIFFQWDDIMQIIIPRSSALASAAGEDIAQEEGNTACPICLAPPTAPRMTKCGHVYCYPCILHYLNTTDTKWARCPICFDSIHERQLKSVKWFDPPAEADIDSPPSGASSASSSSTPTAVPRAGSTLRMRLMQRPQITTLALPRSTTWPSDLVPPHQAPFHFIPDVFNFAKFMLATPAYLISDLTKDLDDLGSERRMLSGMSDDLGITFVDSAETRVQDQLVNAAALENPLLKEKVERTYRDLRDLEARTAFHARRQQELASIPPAVDAAPAELLASTRPTVSVRAPNANRNTKQRRNLNPPPPSSSAYYYYQAASGLPLFLHPLDIKILLSHFQSYSSFPDSIPIRVEAYSEGSVDDDLRKRCKYLGHIPEGADVVFVEADLEAVVGREGLRTFEQALKTRSSRRKEKEKKDDRARARAEERERERLDIDASNVVYWNGQLPPSQPAIDSVIIEPQGVAASAPAPSGAWGNRSFASALHSSQAGPHVPRPRTQRDVEDEWDLDAAWHEMESRTGGASGGGGAGRKKRANKMVVLGGGGGGRRR